MKKSLAKFLAATAGLVAAAAHAHSPRIIGGHPVAAGDYSQVVKLKLNTGACSGTVVGPRTVLTAAHCALPSGGASIAVEINGVPLSAVVHRSPLYPQQDHDLGAVVFDQDLGLVMASVGPSPQVGESVDVAGFGCETVGGGDFPAEVRVGTGSVRGYSNYDLVVGGSALCFGDSGGPALNAGGEVVAIGSKGNLKDQSWFTRLDTEASQDFMQGLIASTQVEVCGVNTHCR